MEDYLYYFFFLCCFLRQDLISQFRLVSKPLDSTCILKSHNPSVSFNLLNAKIKGVYHPAQIFRFFPIFKFYSLHSVDESCQKKKKKRYCGQVWILGFDISVTMNTAQFSSSSHALPSSQFPHLQLCTTTQHFIVDNILIQKRTQIPSQ